MRLRNGTTGELLAERISSVTAPWARAAGYLKRRSVEASEGLWFDRCSTVHTLGMRARIDIVFLDAEQKIVRVVADARRNRIFHGGPLAVTTLELGPGFAERHRLLPGDRLVLE